MYGGEKATNFSDSEGRSDIYRESACEGLDLVTGRSCCLTWPVSRKDREARRWRGDGGGTKYGGKNRGLGGVW